MAHNLFFWLRETIMSYIFEHIYFATPLVFATGWLLSILMKVVKRKFEKRKKNVTTESFQKIPYRQAQLIDEQAIFLSLVAIAMFTYLAWQHATNGETLLQAYVLSGFFSSGIFTQQLYNAHKTKICRIPSSILWVLVHVQLAGGGLLLQNTSKELIQLAHQSEDPFSLFLNLSTYGQAFLISQTMCLSLLIIGRVALVTRLYNWNKRSRRRRTILPDVALLSIFGLLPLYISYGLSLIHI